MSEYEKPLQIGSKSYQIMSDDSYLFKMGNEFEPEMCCLFQSLIQGNFRILDVGAGLTNRNQKEKEYSVYEFTN